MDIRSAARALEGEITGSSVVCAGPNHSRGDRSLSARFDASAPDGFVVHSFAGDDPIAYRDYVRERLGMPAFRPGDGNGKRTIIFEYRDPKTGGVCYRKERIESSDGKKTFRHQKKAAAEASRCFTAASTWPI
jgi:hypothetical protein